MSDHRSRLRDELVAAATRRTEAPHLSGRPGQARNDTLSRRLLGAAAAIVLVVALMVVALITVDERRAAANVFEVSRSGGDLVIEVVDVIDDPTEATRELANAGFSVRMRDRAAPPWLAGGVVAVHMSAGTAAVTTEGSRVTSFRIPGGADEPDVTIEYGRAARPGERYEVSDSVPDCATFSGEPLVQVFDRLRTHYGPDVEIQEIGAAGAAIIDRDDVATDAEVIDVFPLAADAVLVIVTDGDASPPSGMACE